MNYNRCSKLTLLLLRKSWIFYEHFKMLWKSIRRQNRHIIDKHPRSPPTIPTSATTAPTTPTTPNPHNSDNPYNNDPRSTDRQRTSSNLSRLELDILGQLSEDDPCMVPGCSLAMAWPHHNAPRTKQITPQIEVT